MDWGATLLILLRGAHLMALLLLLGTLVACLLVVPPVATDAARHRLLRLAWCAAVGALLIGSAWLVMQAVTIGSANSVSQALSVLWMVIRGTRFGQVVLIQLGFIVLALPFLRAARWSQALALVLTMASSAMQGQIGHAGATGGSTGNALLASEALHLIAAGAWLGALPPLLVLLVTLPPRAAAQACRRFSAIGVAAVLVLIGTAVAQSAALIGNMPGLLGTAYGHIALVKLGLFLLLLGLATANRFSLTARLEQGQPARARRWLLVSVGVETTLGVAVVQAAGFLASGVPAIHEQPYWPFAWRPTLTAMADPNLRHQATVALIVLGFAVVVAAIGVSKRRLRWPAWAGAAALVWVAVPRLGPLFVTAYPTSYDVSPTGFSATSIMRGARLFASHCAACHGANGRGDGPRAAALSARPADLTAPELWRHSDGTLFWWLTDGMKGPKGSRTMPGFGAKLSAEERWALIDYVRALNAGTAMATTGSWPAPVRAPAAPITCRGVAGEEMADLRGSVILVIAGTDDDALADRRVPPQDGLRTVVLRLSPDGATPPAPDACAAVTEAAWPAYALVAGLDPPALRGAAFLVGPAGRLRALSPPDKPAWRTRGELLAAIREIGSHLTATQEEGAHVHSH